MKKQDALKRKISIMLISRSINNSGIILWTHLKSMAKALKNKHIDKTIIDLLPIGGHYTRLLV